LPIPAPLFQNEALMTFLKLLNQFVYKMLWSQTKNIQFKFISVREQ